MMRSFALSIVFLALLASDAQAQIGGIIGRKVNNAVERKVNRKIDEKIEKMVDKMVDQSFDAIFGSETASSDKSGKSEGTPQIFSVLANAPTEPRYDFDASISYDLEQVTRNGRNTEKAAMQMNFAKSAKYMGVHFVPDKKSKDNPDVTVIFDSKNESMVMLMQAEDQKFSVAYGWGDALRYATDEIADDYPTEVDQTIGTMTYKYIGKKKIAGYDADGYRAQDEDGSTVDIWISRDAALAFGRMMGATSSMKQLRAMPTNHPAGVMLEVTTTEKNGDKSVLKATKIDLNSGMKIDMSDYPQMGKAAAGK